MKLSDRPAHFAVLKKQLYEQLLEALHQFDLFTNPEQQLQRGIHQCQLLLQRGLFSQCEKRIGRFWKQAVQMNHHEAQLQLQHLKMMMMARNYYKTGQPNALEAWQQKTNSILSELQSASHYRYLSSKVYKMQYEAGDRGKELATKMKTIVSRPEFTNEKHADTLRAKLDFLQVRALYHFTNSENKKAASFNSRFLKLLEENPLLLELHADRYFSVLNNYLIDCLLLKNFKELNSGLQKMRSLTGQTAFRRLINFDANVFRLGYLIELNAYFATGNFREMKKQFRTITKGLEQFGNRVVKHNRITIQYLMAYGSFALGEYDNAIDYLYPILQEKESAVAENIQQAARMLQLLSHFEKGDFLFTESLVKSLRRMFRNDGAELQRAMLSFILTIIHKHAKDPGAWEKMERKVEMLSKKASVQSALNLFDFNVWLKQHRTGKKFEEVWLEKLH